MAGGCAVPPRSPREPGVVGGLGLLCHQPGRAGPTLQGPRDMGGDVRKVPAQVIR